MPWTTQSINRKELQLMQSHASEITGRVIPGSSSHSTIELSHRPLQKRERTGQEYGCLPFA